MASLNLSTPSVQDKLNQLQFLLLCLLVFSLPNWQAPKSIALGLLLVSVFLERPFVRGDSVRPNTIEVILLLMLATAAVATYQGWAQTQSLRGLKDVAVQCFLFWFMYRHALSEDRKHLLGLSILGGMLIGLAISLGGAPAPTSSRWVFPEIPVINRAAQYVGIGVCLAFGMALLAPRSRTALLKLVSLVVLVLALWFLGSRGAFLGVIAALFLVLLRVARIRLLVWVMVLAAAIALAVSYLPPSAEQARTLAKVHNLITGNFESDTVRVSIWKVAIDHLREGRDFFFGVGPNNFDSILRDGTQFNHAHNWILNKFVEEGILGLAAFAALIVYLAAGLMRKQAEQMPQWLWAAAVGALFVPMLAGLFSGEWMREHAFLAMMILGLWAGEQRRISPHNAQPILGELQARGPGGCTEAKS